MDIVYVDILTGENSSSIKVANMELVYWSVHSSRRRGGNEVREVDGVIVFLANCKNNFITVHENLVQHPSNYISIVTHNDGQ